MFEIIFFNIRFIYKNLHIYIMNLTVGKNKCIVKTKMFDPAVQ